MRFHYVMLLLLLAWTPGAVAQESPYEWTISASVTDPYVNTTSPTGTLATFYLWLACCEESQVQGMAAAEFDLVSSGPTHMATTPQNGFLNAGNTSTLLLAVAGCPCGPIVAAELLVIAEPGTMSFAPSAFSGTKGTADCEFSPTVHPIDWRGIGIGVDPPEKGGINDCNIVGECVGYICLPDGNCEKILCSYPCPNGCGDVATCEECEPTSVEAASWGRLKGLYR